MKFAVMKLFRRSKTSKAERKKATQQVFNFDRGERDSAGSHGRLDGKGPLFRCDTHGYYSGGTGFAPWLELPEPMLQRVFAFVCPHSTDESYESCEDSAIEDACMLCDLRDLAHVGMVCRGWRKMAVKMMYHSIRIDAVHYCEREIYLSEKRKRRSRFDRNGIPEDTASARLNLLCRTLREDATRLGTLVQYFKTPYMLRESKKSDLARTIAVLPNLRYVDLPEGVFLDDPGYQTLRLEVQARCPDLRKMTYLGGSERSLEMLGNGHVWPKLEVLELGRIHMDPAMLRRVLSTLRCLRALKLSETSTVDDDLFRHNDVLPAFPALEEVIFKETPRMTEAGLMAYLSRPDARQTLKVLSLVETGVPADKLHHVLASAPRLQALTIVDDVDAAFPLNADLPPMASSSLHTLRFEITAGSSASQYGNMTQGYYNYLASSLSAAGFPHLRTLYVRDQNFPDLLLGLPPPNAGYGGLSARPSSSNSAKMFSGGSSMNLPGRPSTNPFADVSSTRKTGFPNGRSTTGFGPTGLALNQTLEVFTKGANDMDWGIVKMDPYDSPGYAGGRGAGSLPRHGRTGSTLSAHSGYGLSDGAAGWREGAGGARKSIVVGDGVGGFLAVPGDDGRDRRGSTPDDWPRSRNRGGKSDRDLWR